MQQPENLILSMLTTFATCFLIAQFSIWLRGDVVAAESAYKGMEIAALSGALVYSYIQTAFSEESYSGAFY